MPLVSYEIIKTKFPLVKTGDAVDAIGRPLMPEIGGSRCRCISMDLEYSKWPLVWCEIIKIEFSCVTMQNALVAIERPVMNEIGGSR